MTLPTVINDAKDRQFRAKWKKTFAAVANAYNYAYQDDPTYFEKLYGAGKVPVAAQLYYRIFSNLNTYDYCVDSAQEGKICPTQGQGITNGNGSPTCNSLNNDKSSGPWCMYNGYGGVAFLTDGTIIYAHGYLWDYPQLLVDVNGKKGPNVVGRDMFIILFKENKVIPGGADGYELKGCDKNISSDEGSHDARRFSGSGCGAKYLLE